MKVVFAGLALLMALSACDRKAPVLFDGRTYKASIDAPRADRRDFTVVVRDAAGNADAARRAGRYEAVQYCIKRLGGSEILWANSPETNPAGLLTAEGQLVMQGKCDHR